MQRAAGGTSQRLKPAFAIIRSRSRSPAAESTSPPACSIVVMAFPLFGGPFFLGARSLGLSVTIPLLSDARRPDARVAQARRLRPRHARGSRRAYEDPKIF